MFKAAVIKMIVLGMGETLYMTLLSTALAYLLGLPLGIILVVTEKDGIRPQRFLNRILNFIINVIRSVPFLILLSQNSITRFIVGK